MSFAAHLLEDEYHPNDVSPGSLTPSGVERNGNDIEHNGIERNGVGHTDKHEDWHPVNRTPSNVPSDLHAHFTDTPAEQPSSQNKKIAVLTSGGDSAGMNAAGEWISA
jgi:hypothetical protein